MVGAALRPLAAVLPVVPVVSFPVWLHHEAVSGWRGRCWGRSVPARPGAAGGAGEAPARRWGLRAAGATGRPAGRRKER